MYINDMNEVRDVIFKNVLGKVIVKGCENLEVNDTTLAIAGNVLDGLGINPKTLTKMVANESAQDGNIIAKSLLNAIDSAASKVMRDASGKYIEDDKVHEFIIKGYEDEETPNVLADTINEILNNAVTSMQGDIKTASKMVLQLIKENQDAEKKDKESELDDFDNPDMEEKNADNGDNPEDKDNTEGDDTNPDSGDGENPFEDGDKGGEEPDDKNSDDNGKDNTEDKGEDTQKAEGDGGDEGAGDVEENPFESMTYKNIDIVLKNWNNGYDIRAFEGLTCSDITKFAVFCANEHVGDKLNAAYGKMNGMEDEEFTKNAKLFKDTARAYGEITVATLLTVGKLGIKGNNNCIKYPNAYVE